VPESGSKGEGSVSQAHRKIIYAYARLSSFVAAAKECSTNERHVRRVVELHPDLLEELLAEIREEDSAWERRRRDAARASQEAQDTWVDEGTAKIRTKIDEAIDHSDPRVYIPAIRLKLALRSKFTVSTEVLDGARERRHAAVDEGFGNPS